MSNGIAIAGIGIAALATGILISRVFAAPGTHPKAPDAPPNPNRGNPPVQQTPNNDALAIAGINAAERALEKVLDAAFD